MLEENLIKRDNVFTRDREMREQFQIRQLARLKLSTCRSASEATN